MTRYTIAQSANGVRLFQSCAIAPKECGFDIRESLFEPVPFGGTFCAFSVLSL
jgi:hypothetical protein